MSCWVVPEIAADLWGIPLEQILERISDGSIPIKREGEFVFVDVKPRPSLAPENADPRGPSLVIFDHPRWEAPRDEIASRRRPPRAA